MRLDWEPLRGHGLTTGVVRHACRHRVTARGGFCFGGLFHTLWSAHSAPSRRWRDATSIDARFVFLVLWGALLPFVLRACCGGMCWPQERPATHAAAGAAARGVRGDWGILLRLDWEPLREHGLTTGVVRHACRLRRDGTRRFLVWGILSHARSLGTTQRPRSENRAGGVRDGKLLTFPPSNSPSPRARFLRRRPGRDAAVFRGRPFA